jgi:hypothetical protein
MTTQILGTEAIETLRADNPSYRLREVDQTVPAGMWQIDAQAGDLLFQAATAADWTAFTTVVTMTSTPSITIHGTVTFSGTIAFAANVRLDDDIVVLFGDGSDYYMGYSATDDKLEIGTGATIASNVAMDIDTSANVSFPNGGVSCLSLTATAETAFSTGVLAVKASDSGSRFAMHPVTAVGGGSNTNFKVYADGISLTGADPSTYPSLDNVVVEALTYNPTNSNQTVTTAATFRIGGPPSGAPTFTNGPYALRVDAGVSYFAGDVEIFGADLGIGRTPERSVDITSSGTDGVRYERNNQHGWELVSDDGDGEVRFQVSDDTGNEGPVETSTVWATYDNKAIASLVLQLMPDGGKITVGASEIEGPATFTLSTVSGDFVVAPSGVNSYEFSDTRADFRNNTLHNVGDAGNDWTNVHLTSAVKIIGSAGVRIGADADANAIDDASTGSGSTALYIGNASINVTSDMRLKHNVRPYLEDAAMLLQGIPVVEFDMDTHRPYGDVEHYVGVTAQALYKVAPWCVNTQGGRDCAECLAGASCDHLPWAVNYELLSGVFIRGFQQMDSRYEELASRLEAIGA